MATLFDDASLVMIPSGKKDGKLYSIKPTDGSGDFTFSRDGAGASRGTRVDADGNIETGRTNFLLQSNQFDTTWTTSGTSVTGGQADKDGGTDAWLLSVASGTNSQRVVQSVAFNEVRTFSVYAKAGTLDWIRLRCLGGGSPDAYFDISNGVLGSTTGGSIISSIEDAGNGFYRCSVAVNDSITEVRIHLASGDLNVTQSSGNIYIQDSQLENGLVATDYIETTTTAGYAGLLGDMPRLDYSGGATCPSLLLEPSRTNLAPLSNYFDGTNWNKVGSLTTSLNTSETTSPQGLNNATLLTSASATSEQYLVLSALSTTSGNDYTWTVYAKKKDFDYIALRVQGSGGAFTAAGAWFDINTGNVGTEDSGITGTIKDFGNGWYKCSITATAIGTTSAAACRIQLASSDNSANVVGDGTSGTYIYQSQFEEGSYPTSLIPTYGSTVTRAVDNASLTSYADAPTGYPFSVYIDHETSDDDNEQYMFSFLDITDSDEYFTISYTKSSGTYSIQARTSAGTISEAVTGVAEGRHKVLGVWDSNGFKLFIDGVKEIDNVETLPAFEASIDSYILGNLRTVSDLGRRNSVKEFDTWNTATSDSEGVSRTTL